MDDVLIARFDKCRKLPALACTERDAADTDGITATIPIDILAANNQRVIFASVSVASLQPGESHSARRQPD